MQSSNTVMTTSSDDEFKLDKNYLKQLWNKPCNQPKIDWYFATVSPDERLIREKYYFDLKKFKKTFRLFLLARIFRKNIIKWNL
jgi:hypothetical protein